ncbi:PREDICTED: phosphatidate phosphatase PAH1-like isoform X2 [Brassica oleracea var. oleracea]|uniref:phosphatidate phosphatase PAH1-like isoform X2 n=1 Tax=Brassica oleracea var. oleracea TaxID=109376 RepID=UPI0006A6C4A0|nr:PREDICTED: phosphatidate phosphatase PAH1-like isoform X2 [Brassica oleracea var. oleracea]
MSLVGRVGSLISQGVYSVATPFHPFGGAIDVIVVQQEDGSFRSTPWYVRFGKFQGVLKGAEKFVKISVNGDEADFHMYLDNSGEAYFIREVDPETTNNLISSSEDSNGSERVLTLEHSSSDVGAGELREGLSSLNRLDRTESDSNGRYYDFQDDPPSPTSEYGSARFDNLNVESYGDSSPGLDSEVVLVSVDGHILTAPVSAEEQEAENLRLNTPQFHLAPGDGTEFCEGNTEFASSETSWDTEFISKVESSNAVDIGSKKVDIGSVECNDENAKSEEAASNFEVQNLKEGELVPTTIKESVGGDDDQVAIERDIAGSCLEQSEEAASTFEVQNLKEETAILIENQEGEIIEPEERVSIDSTREEDEQLTPSKPSEEDNENNNTTDSVAETSNIARSETDLKYELSLCKDELRQGMGLTAAAEVFNTHLISTEEYKNSAASILESENLVVRIRETYMPWKKAARIVLGKVVFDLDLEIQPEDVISVEETKPKDDETAAVTTPSSSGRRWRLWPIPFRRVKTVEHTTSSNSSSEEDLFVDSEPGLQNSPEVLSTNESPRRQLVRTNVPTNEQIASLNLKDGQNMITFSFSTRVLGTQQVDAHIYRWRWDTKIVISDVDGTITKSDVLGQFMPLVGRDWTQSGVAKLFSAIKENGYQLLFLSARAIVQAYLTRSFLNNLKQDGKALPNGPVVISPDGLFPALYREVIRRAPHEFKIACLEDIKKLFPEHYNPFYAGFGNRDTDELSYSKLGIPKGKIFIINPKGEVATGHRVDVKKSYTSLHTLVNDMFPPTSLVEQEDYNPWNFWKLPIEEVD